MKRNLLLGSVTMIALLLVAASLRADKTKSEEAFDRLATLKGEWSGEQEGVKIRLIYTLTANGSALMEEFRPESGAVMITMFTVDGDHLIATHYCSAKNQPQMITSAITDVQKPLAFSLARITGLKSPDDWHNTGLTIIQADNEHLTQEWTYQSKEKSGKRIFRYTRVQP
jgi:DNA-binding PadR family transcriptional regulator